MIYTFFPEISEGVWFNMLLPSQSGYKQQEKSDLQLL